MGIEPFADIYTRYYRLILTTAHQRLGSFDDAQDATAIVFRIAWEKYSSGNKIDLPWLYQTLRNVVGNEYRRRNRVDSLFSKLAPMYQESVDGDPADDRVTVRAAMQKLKPGEIDLLRMAYWEDLSASEIAQILNTTAPAIRLRLLRARLRLKSLVSTDSLSDAEPTTISKEVTSNAIHQVENQNARPYSGNRFQPLTARAHREFFELTGTPLPGAENSATTRNTTNHSALNSNRRLMSAGVGILSVIIIALITIFAAAAPTTAFAATPRPLQFSPMNISPHDLLMNLAAIAKGGVEPAPTDQIRVQTWSLSITDYGNQSEQVWIITPEQYIISLNPDGSRTQEVRAGLPIDPDGNPIQDAVSVPPAGTLLWSETFPADRNLFTGPVPTLAGDVSGFLQKGMIRDTAPNSASYFRAIAQLMLQRNLTREETATILEFLSDLPDIEIAGAVTDRLGRDGLAIKASHTWHGNEVTEYLILAPVNGQIIASETVHENGILSGQSGPTVTEYYAWER